MLEGHYWPIPVLLWSSFLPQHHEFHISHWSPLLQITWGSLSEREGNKLRSPQPNLPCSGVPADHWPITPVSTTWIILGNTVSGWSRTGASLTPSVWQGWKWKLTWHGRTAVSVLLGFRARCCWGLYVCLCGVTSTLRNPPRSGLNNRNYTAAKTH